MHICLSIFLYRDILQSSCNKAIASYDQSRGCGLKLATQTFWGKYVREFFLTAMSLHAFGGNLLLSVFSLMWNLFYNCLFFVLVVENEKMLRPS